MKKLLSIITLSALILSFAACGGNKTPEPVESTSPVTTDMNVPATGKEITIMSVARSRELNEKIAEAYEKEKGVKVKIIDSNTEEDPSADGSADIFHLSPYSDFAKIKDSCADLKNTELYSALSDKTMALTLGDSVYGIPYIMEGYGIIYNEEITDKYFTLDTKQTDFSSMKDINSFVDLKALVLDMTKNKETLGIQGVFASPVLSGKDSAYFTSQLMNVPFHYEMDEKDGYDSSIIAGLKAEDITFTHGKHLQDFLDLYLANSVTDKSTAGEEASESAREEFISGKAAMIADSSGISEDIKGSGEEKVKADKMKILPLYMGLEGESDQGLCISPKGYVAVNAKSSPEKIKAAEDFLYWLFSSQGAKELLSEYESFITPFRTMSDITVKDPLALQVLNFVNSDDKDNIPPAYMSFPQGEFTEGLAEAFIQYIKGSVPWSETEEKIKDAWSRTKKALKESETEETTVKH